GQRTYELTDVYQRRLRKTLEASSEQLSLLADTGGIDSAVAIRELTVQLTKALQEIDSCPPYAELDIPKESILAKMEATGIAVNVDTLESQQEVFANPVAAEEKAARELAGDDSLNLNSPKQLQTVLFETLDLPKTKKTKTGYSTAAKE